MAEITLRCGAVALVDDDDYDGLNKLTWCLSALGAVVVALNDQKADERRKAFLRKKYGRIWGIF